MLECAYHEICFFFFSTTREETQITRATAWLWNVSKQAGCAHGKASAIRHGLPHVPPSPQQRQPDRDVIESWMARREIEREREGGRERERER